MHKGTPVIYDDQLYIYHGGGGMGSNKIRLYNPNSDTMVSKTGRGSVHLLNQEPFNPQSQIKLKWGEILSPEIYIGRQYGVRYVEQLADRITWPTLLHIPPSQWPVVVDGKVPQHRPMRCLLETGNGTVYVPDMDRTISLDHGGNVDIHVQIEENQGWSWQARVLYDPDKRIQMWQIRTMIMVRKALKAHDEYLHRPKQDKTEDKDVN